jgi:cellulose 1,4-beta-cellobiosidase
VGVVSYDVQMKQDGAFVTIQNTTFTGVSVSPLVPGQSYTFRVIAKDAAGNASPPSAEYTAVATVYTGTGSPTPSPSPAVPDRTAPTRPEGVQPYSAYINGAAGLTWTKSTDDVAVSGYDVYAWIDGAFSRVPAEVSAQTGDKVLATVGDLTPGRDYLFYVVAKDAAGNLSAPSDLVRQRAMVEPPTASPSPGTDTTPPGTPTGLSSSGGLPIPGGIFLSWQSVSDNSGVLPRYDLFRRTDHGYAYEGENVTPRDIVTGLEGGKSYTFQVVARDAAGNLSNPSAPHTAVAQPEEEEPALSCDVSYSAHTWPGGFLANVQITNTGTTAVDGWKLAFSFPLTTQRLDYGFSAVWKQTGSEVTAENAAWNKTIKPGQSLYIGFNGIQTAGNPSPAAFTLNGTTCS